MGVADLQAVSRKLFVALTAGLSSAMVAPAANAQIVEAVWVAPSGEWDVGANWSTGVRPRPEDSVVIDNDTPSPLLVFGSAGSPTITYLDLGLSGHGTSALSLQGPLTVTEVATIGPVGSLQIHNSSATVGMLLGSGAVEMGASGTLYVGGSIAKIKGGANFSGTFSSTGSVYKIGDTTHAFQTLVPNLTVVEGWALANGSVQRSAAIANSTDFLTGPGLELRFAGGMPFGIPITINTYDASLASRAEILIGDATGKAPAGGGSLSVQWRDAGVAESDLLSSVLRLQGLNDRSFVLGVTYAPPANEEELAAEGELFLGWRNAESEWVNAVEGNRPTFVIDDPQLIENYQGSFAEFAEEFGVVFGDDPNLSRFLGSWGVDIETDTAWAVLNHNSEFGVDFSAVPEPGTWILLGLAGSVWLVRYRLRYVTPTKVPASPELPR